jgi:hypothetical protein
VPAMPSMMDAVSATIFDGVRAIHQKHDYQYELTHF